MKKGKEVFLSLSSSSDELNQSALRYCAPELERPEELKKKKKKKKKKEEKKTKEKENTRGNEDSIEKEKSVVFSFGLLMVECLTGEAPLSEEGEISAHKKIQEGELPSLEEIEEEEEEEEETKEVVKILKKMMLMDIKKRPSLKEAIELMRKVVEDAMNDGDDEEDESSSSDSSEDILNSISL